MTALRRSSLAAPAVAFLACAAAGPAARAELLVYEPFDYAAGAVLNGEAATGLNLAGGYADATTPGFKLRVGSPGLGYGALLGPGGVAPPAGGAMGNRLTQTSGTTSGASTVSIDQDVTIGAGESIYFSALFTFSDADNGNHLARLALVDDSTGHAIAFGEAGVGVRNVRIESDMTSTGGPLAAAGADAAFTSGQTLWLIGRYTNSAAPEGDSLDLIGYDTALAQAIAPTFDLADASAQFAFTLDGLDVNLASIGSLRFTIRGNDNNYIDELRIGETYADVTVPAPAAAGTLALGALALAGRRRRTA